MADQDEETVRKILSEINMNEKDLEEAIKSMKEWLTKRPHLPEAAKEDNLLKAFIIGCKSVERAKEKLDKYFTYRLNFKDLLFKTRDPREIDWTKVGMKFSMLPGMTREGYKVFFMSLPDKEDVPNCVPEEFIKLYLMIMDSYIREGYLNSGLYVVFDMSRLSMELMMKTSITLTSSFIKVFNGSYPLRNKGIICVNASNLTQTLFSTLISPFLSTKLKQRVRILADDHNACKEYFPLEMLPSDYAGGKSASLAEFNDMTRKRLERDRDWFMNEGIQTANEHLRPLDDSDQLKGTFRKLQID